MTDLNDRQRRILGRLVAEYIEQGEPVSSAWLAEHSDLGLSSATVRNILARLEEQGLVKQRHTSAGRVPTDSGYRLYVDWLLGSRKPSRARPEIEARLRQAATVSDLLGHVSHELSQASHQIGFALSSSSPAARLRHIDFVNLEGRRVLVVVVASGGQITHKIVETDELCESSMLTQAANYINAEFAGLTLHEVRTGIVGRMREERMLYDALAARALQLAQTGLGEETPDGTLHVQGVSFLLDELMGGQDARDLTVHTLRELFRMIEEKHRLVELLTHYIEASGLTVVIGSEHSSPDMQSFSLVASTFSDGQRTGTVGVIGPTRMKYHRAIAVVDSVSAAMTRVFEEP
jgi:heat-inducible transcriptional repressor